MAVRQRTDVVSESSARSISYESTTSRADRFRASVSWNRPTAVPSAVFRPPECSHRCRSSRGVRSRLRPGGFTLSYPRIAGSRSPLLAAEQAILEIVGAQAYLIL